MDGRNFANRLNKMSKNILKPLIPALGLHKRVERVLYLRYVEEQSIYDIAEDVGMSFDSLNNYLSFARHEMLSTMQRDFEILPDDIKKLVNIVLSDC